ncbi:MAG: MFS transporter [Gammaproteobacteria bacterium]|nr:MFS transporter [Gammaproteobacteria bacterium]
MTGSTPEIRAYRWVICACSFLVLFVSQGMTLGGMAVFDIQLINTITDVSGTEVSVSDIKWRDTIMFLTAAVSGLGSGWLADKVGVKPLLLVGLAMLAAGNLLYARVDQLVEAYWISAGLGVVLALCGLMINVYLISSWFDKQRGLAIGIVLSGTSLGSAFFPKLNTWMISTADWRQAFEWLALIPLILVPISFVLLRNGPMSAGKPDGTRAGGPTPELTGYTLAQALRSRNFWLLAIIAMCTFYSILGMTTNVFIYMSKSDYSPQVASTGVSILFIGGLIGKLISGYLAENLGRKLILLVGLFLMLSGGICLLLAISWTSEMALWCGLVLFGFGWGGIYTLIQLLSPDLFGMRSLGKILAAINILDATGGAAGPVVTGALYGSSGSYFLPFAVITGFLLIAGIAATLLDMSKAAGYETAGTQPT